jgi:hypothetical protein
MEAFCAFVVFSLVPAIIAPSRGRNPFAWFAISVLLSPLVGGVLILALPILKTAPRAE